VPRLASPRLTRSRAGPCGLVGCQGAEDGLGHGHQALHHVAVIGGASTMWVSEIGTVRDLAGAPLVSQPVDEGTPALVGGGRQRRQFGLLQQLGRLTERERVAVGRRPVLTGVKTVPTSGNEDKVGVQNDVATHHPGPKAVAPCYLQLTEQFGDGRVDRPSVVASQARAADCDVVDGVTLLALMQPFAQEQFSGWERQMLPVQTTSRMKAAMTATTYGAPPRGRRNSDRAASHSSGGGCDSCDLAGRGLRGDVGPDHHVDQSVR